MADDRRGRLLKLLRGYEAKIADVEFKLPPRPGIPRRREVPPSVVIGKVRARRDSAMFRVYRTLLASAGAALLVCVCALIWMWTVRPETTARATPVAEQGVPFPAWLPRGLIAYGGRFTSADGSSGQLVRLDPQSSRILSKFPFPNPSVSGLSQGLSCIWSTDARRARILRHDEKTFAVLAEYASPGAAPTAIHYDGAELWTFDKQSNKIYRHALDGKLTVRAEQAIEESEVVGMHRVGKHLWVLDAASRMLVRYRIAKRLVRDGEAPVGDLIPSSAKVAGLSVKAPWVWVLTHRQGSLHRFPIKGLKFE